MTFIERIEALLSQARPDGVYSEITAGLAEGAINPRAHIGSNGPDTYVAEPGEVMLSSEPARLLERLYRSVASEDQLFFTRVLMPRLNRANARVVARTLATTGQLHALMIPIDSEAIWEELWRGLIHAMRYEPGLFSEQDLQTVEDAAQARLREVAAREQAHLKQTHSDVDPTAPVHVMPHDPVVKEARAVMARIRFLRLRHQLDRQPADTKEPEAVDEALLDALVGLPTRRVLTEEFAARTTERDVPLSMVLFDLDHFKSVNDDHGGHATGDEALISVAGVAETCVKGKGRAYRLGGDEFVLLLPNHSVQEGLAVAERFRRAVEATPRTSRQLTLTVSVGVAEWPSHGGDFDALYKAADAALYDVKKRGKNLVRAYGEPEPQTLLPREPERRQPEPGGLSADEERKIREDYFRTRIARCPRDEALLQVEDITAMGQLRNSLYVSCPLCGLMAELD